MIEYEMYNPDLRPTRTRNNMQLFKYYLVLVGMSHDFYFEQSYRFCLIGLIFRQMSLYKNVIVFFDASSTTTMEIFLGFFNHAIVRCIRCPHPSEVVIQKERFLLYIL